MPLPADQLFRLASTGVLAGWAALAVAPLNRPLAVKCARVVAAIVCGLYLTLLVRALVTGPGLPPGASFTTLDGVRLLFTRPQAVLAGWMHYLAFDLWAGSWEVEDNRLPHWLLLVCLGLTFFAGPAGLLLYLLLAATRVSRRRTRGRG